MVYWVPVLADSQTTSLQTGVSFDSTSDRPRYAVIGEVLGSCPVCPTNQMRHVS